MAVFGRCLYAYRPGIHFPCGAAPDELHALCNSNPAAWTIPRVPRPLSRTLLYNSLACPVQLFYDTQFTISWGPLMAQNPNVPVTSVSIVAPSATTHCFNTNQVRGEGVCLWGEGGVRCCSARMAAAFAIECCDGSCSCTLNSPGGVVCCTQSSLCKQIQHLIQVTCQPLYHLSA
jgi:hypothetical protein